jgi:hypothetical protein
VINSNTFFPEKKQTWLIGFLALNIVIYAVVMCSVPGDTAFLLTRLKAHWEILLILYLGMVVILVAGNLIKGRFKAVLVFWDWSQTLPIARVFTRYLPNKNAMDSEAQDGRDNQLPSNPTEQEALWLKIYGKYKNNPAVIDTRNDFLLAQELTWLSFVLLVFFGVGSLITGKSTLQTLAYPAFLLIQYITASIVARSLGIRFSGDVLAVGGVHKIN